MSETTAKNETLPAAKGDNNQSITVNDGRLTYPSASEGGFVEIELPALKGSPNPTERLLAKDFGPHVIGKIEAAMARQPYLESGLQQTPSQIFRHYVAVARGASLADQGTLRRMEAVAQEFDEDPEPQEFWSQVLRPWLGSLVPRKR